MSMSHNRTNKEYLPSEDELFEMIRDCASCHPHRNWMYEGYKLKDTEQAREINLAHWRELAKTISERINND